MPDPAPSLRTREMHGFLDRWRDGDRAAADDLIRRAGDRLRRLARRMYRRFPNVRQLADSGDVIQDSWVRLLRSLQKHRPDHTRDFFNLAAVHVRRELLDLARQAKSAKYQFVSLQTGGRGGESSTGVAVPEPEEPVPDDFDLWVRFHEAVGELDAEKREVVNLIFYHGRPRAEIAAWFGVSERTVGRRWADACLELRARVGGSFPDGGED